MSKEGLARQDEADFRAVARFAPGARFLSRLIDFCGVYEPNPEASAFREGMRNAGLFAVALAEKMDGGEAALSAAKRERARIFRGDETDEEDDD